MQKNKAIEIDPRIACSLHKLLSLKEKAIGFTFLPKYVPTSKLSGRHGSKFRGRGINFEELRSYKVGDDVKSIDWKVTLKTGTPHIRVYSEEKDRNVILCVDQTESMFFSSIDTMKSVVSAELAALCAWRALSDNDRVGAILMSNEENKYYSPKRGNKELVKLLTDITKTNQDLVFHKEKYLQKKDNKIKKTLDILLSNKTSQSIIIIISDFYNLSNESINKMKVLQEHNDILCIDIIDELEKNWKEQDDLIFSDGIMQLNITKKDENEKVSNFFVDKYNKKTSSLLKVLQAKGLPLIEIGTNGEHIKDFIKQIGGGSNV